MPPLHSTVTSANLLTKSFLRSKGHSRKLSDRATLQGNKSGATTIRSYSFSCQYQYVSYAPRINSKIQPNLTVSNAAVAQQRSYSTSIKKDKYGRILRRRVFVVKDRYSKHKTKTNSNVWPKLPKIITPLNVPLQPIQPPPSTNLNLRRVANQKPGATAPSSSSTSVSVAAPATKSTTTSTAKTLTKQQQLISKEKQMMSATTIPPIVKTKKFRKWFVANSGTIILNIGSLCTLTAFTRADMFELRCLSIVGSMSTIFYFLSRPPPFVYGPMLWSAIFLSTNVFMAYFILEEREGKTRQFTKKEEDLYEEHFLPYGVTPRQYEKLLNIMVQVKLKRGEVLLHKGDKFDAVYLVASGSTCGMTVGNISRRVTAAGSTKGNKDKLSGGDAGAWIGELTFLEILGNLQKSTKVSNATNTATNNSSDGNNESNESDEAGESSVVKTLATATANVLERASSRQKEIESQATANNHVGKTPQQRSSPPSPNQANKLDGRAILTYIAVQDAIIYKWDFDELANLLRTSTELRVAVTRAMTAAVVNKVVNLYLSKEDTDSEPGLWKRWIHGANETAGTIQEVEKQEKVALRRYGTVRLNVVPKDS